MGWSTTVIAPDGDMTEYMASLDLLLERMMWLLTTGAH